MGRLIDADTAKAMYPDCRGFCEKIDRVPTMPTFGQWISVKDRNPGIDGQYLVIAWNDLWIWSDEHAQEVTTSFFENGEWDWELREYITFWMEMPSMPEELIERKVAKWDE